MQSEGHAKRDQHESRLSGVAVEASAIGGGAGPEVVPEELDFALDQCPDLICHLPGDELLGGGMLVLQDFDMAKSAQEVIILGKQFPGLSARRFCGDERPDVQIVYGEGFSQALLSLSNCRKLAESGMSTLYPLQEQFRSPRDKISRVRQGLGQLLSAIDDERFAGYEFLPDEKEYRLGDVPWVAGLAEGEPGTDFTPAFGSHAGGLEHRAGGHGVHADMRGEGQSGGLREHLHARLADGVHWEAGPGLQPCDVRDVDDYPTSAGEHRPGGVLEAKERRCEIQIDRAIPVILGGIH